MKKILLVDDDKNLSRSLANLFDSQDFNFDFLEDGSEVKKIIADNSKYDLVMLDVNLPTMSGLEVLKEIKKVNKTIPVIVISGFVSTENAIQAIREGAFEYLTKPFELKKLVATVNRACGLSAQATEAPSVSHANQISSGEVGLMIGKAPEIVEIAKMVGQLSRSNVPVLIVGEQGTGKELVAKAIHRNSLLSSNQFLAINCAAMPESLLESELFGHEKGAFTGAYYKRIGKIEQANQGTLFLADIGKASMLTQSKLLRVLQEGKFERVGGEESIDVDTRLIVSSSGSLVEAMKEGSFRVDLFYKLKVASIYIPPLRDRRNDIPLLVDYFLGKYSGNNSDNPKRISKEAMQYLSGYDWPGNVRELENNVQSAVMMGRSDILSLDDFPAYTERNSTNGKKNSEIKSDYTDSFKNIIEPVMPKLILNSPGQIYQFLESAFERAIISSCLKLFNGNQVKTSESLGISRNTLRDRISRYDLY